MREINVYLRAARQLAQKLDHEPSVEEIAVLLDKPIGEVERMLGLNERIASMDMPYGKEADRPLLDTIPDEDIRDFTDQIQNERLTAQLERWLTKLNDKTREVVERRFGLHGYEHSTLEQLAAELGVTCERVRQIQMDALKRLRHILEQDGLATGTAGRLSAYGSTPSRPVLSGDGGSAPDRVHCFHFRTSSGFALVNTQPCT